MFFYYFKFLAKQPSGENISHIIIHALMLKHLKGANTKIQNMLDLKLEISPAASMIFAVEINFAIFLLHIFTTVVICFIARYRVG